MEYIWSVTGKCDLKCKYCWDPYKNSSQLCYEDCCLLIRKLVDSGCNMLIFTGGEPTVHEKFFEIVKYAYERGIKELKICTNGFKLPQIKDKLLQSAIKEIHISVNKAKDIVNRRDFHQYKEAIKELKASGKKIVFVSIIDIFRLESYISVLELAKELEITATFQFMAKPEDESIICLSDLDKQAKEAIFKKIENIHNFFKKNIDPLTFSYYSIAKRYYLYNDIPEFCYADEKYRIISPNGVITPCYWRQEKDSALSKCFTDKCLVWFRYNRRLEQIYKMMKSEK